MKKVVLVLGMHRSATSLTTKLLYSHGLFVGDNKDLLEANENNPQGYYENKYVVLVNDRILYEHRIHWAVSKSEVECRLETEYTDEVKKILDDMVRKSGKDQTLLLKDPRMCLLEPIWKKQILSSGMEECIVMVFRHPYEVAASLQARDNMDFIYAMKLWFFYNLSALYCIAECDTQVLIINHNDYFLDDQKQFRKIEDFLRYHGINAYSEVGQIVEHALRHNQAKEIDREINPMLDSAVLELYDYLLELSEREKVMINKEVLNRFSINLKHIVSTSFLKDSKDMMPKVFRGCIEMEKKLWCTYQLQHKGEALVKLFLEYSREKGINQWNIYGNGTLTQFLLKIFEKAEIKVGAIYDKNQTFNPVTSQMGIRVIKINELDNVRGIILNTAVNYWEQIREELQDKLLEGEVLDLYELLYVML